MRTFNSKSFRKSINREYGSVSKLKSYLRKSAVDTGYDCSLSEVLIDGVSVKYTSNPNHFARYFVQLPHVGFSSTTALDRSSYTVAGRRRCGNLSSIF